MKCAKCGVQKRKRIGHWFHSTTGRLFWICRECFSKRMTHIREDILGMRRKGLL